MAPTQLDLQTGSAAENTGPPERLASITKLPYQPPWAFRLGFTGLCVMVLIASLDGTALSTSLAVVADDLNGSTLASFWASTAFLLANVVSMPIYMAMVDIVGLTTPLNVALLFFSVGAIVFSTAETMIVLIVGRVLQGLGAGGLDVLPEMIIADITTLKERPLYVGLLGIPMALGSCLGPIIGALFAQSSNWRWIGWINLPLSAISFALCLRIKSGKIPRSWMWQRFRGADWLGMFLLTIGLAFFVLPLSWADSLFPWASWQTLVPLLVAVLVLVLLGIYEQCWPSMPILPGRLFAPLTAKTSLVVVLMQGSILYTLMLYVPLYFQSVKLQVPIRTVLSMLPLTLAVVGFSGIAGFAVERLGKYAWILRIGSIFMTVGIGLLSLLNRSTSLGEQTVFELIVGVGLGTVNIIITIPMQASVLNTADTGLAVGMISLGRQLGGAIGLAAASSVFSSFFVTPAGNTELEKWSGPNAVSLIPTLRSANLSALALEEITVSYRNSFSTIWWTMSAFSAVGFLASIWIQDYSLEDVVF